MAFFIVCFKKYDFLRTTSNVAKLYTIGKDSSSRVWIWDRYLKIRFCLARIHLQSFCIHGNMCEWSCRFRQKMRSLWLSWNHPHVLFKTSGDNSPRDTPQANISVYVIGELGPGVSTPSKLRRSMREAGRVWGSALLVRPWRRDGGRRESDHGEEREEGEEKEKKRKLSGWGAVTCQVPIGGFSKFQI